MKKIPVTKPFLPPKEEYLNCINQIWQNGWLTNNGPFVKQLERELKDYLDFENLVFVSNGTIAIQIAIKALDLSGDIITTPFSYVATTSSIEWENCNAVFADIDPLTLNIDPSSIESCITKKTTAILATHVYGNPCDIDRIKEIADKNNLKVIYDAAHCFGTKYKGKSVFEYGDITTTSFHATKLFHTGEGGAIFAKSTEILEKLKTLRNFGHTTPGEYAGIGINGKNSEFHAAMGVCNLKYIDEILEKRKLISLRYEEIIDFNLVQKVQKISDGFNYAYFPIILDDEFVTTKVKQYMESKNIFPRRYFFPSLNTLNYVEDKNNTPISMDISKRVLCLPVYHDLDLKDIDLVVDVLHSALKKDLLLK